MARTSYTCGFLTLTGYFLVDGGGGGGGEVEVFLELRPQSRAFLILAFASDRRM